MWSWPPESGKRPVFAPIPNNNAFSYPVRYQPHRPEQTLLKRVFQIDVGTCPNCGGTVQIIACIEDPPVIERILTHLDKKDLPGLWAESRAPSAKRIDLHS